MVPDSEHDTVNAEKANSLIKRLRGIRNELFDDENRTFKFAGRQIGIAIALLIEGDEGDWNGFEDEMCSGCSRS